MRLVFTYPKKLLLLGTKLKTIFYKTLWYIHYYLINSIFLDIYLHKFNNIHIRMTIKPKCAISLSLSFSPSNTHKHRHTHMHRLEKRKCINIRLYTSNFCNFFSLFLWKCMFVTFFILQLQYFKSLFFFISPDLWHYL